MRFYRLLPTLLSSCLLFMMQVGPDDAVRNLCKWPRLGWPDLTENCVSGMNDAWLYLVVAVMAIVGIVWFLWPTIHSRFLAQKALTQGGRISIMELLNLAEKNGWNVRGSESLEGVDLLEGLRQAGSDGQVQLWGRPNKNDFESLNRGEVLAKIPQEHWNTFRIDWCAVGATDNFQIISDHPTAPRHPRRERGAYLDLHADRRTAIEWLYKDASIYRGNTRKRHPKREVINQNVTSHNQSGGVTTFGIYTPEQLGRMRDD